MKPYCVTIQMKAIEQYFHVVLTYIMLYKVVLTLLKCRDESLFYDQSNESYIVVQTIPLNSPPSVAREWIFQISHGVDHEPVRPRQLPKSTGCGKNFPGKSKLATGEQVRGFH